MNSSFSLVFLDEANRQMKNVYDGAECYVIWGFLRV